MSFCARPVESGGGMAAVAAPKSAGRERVRKGREKRGMKEKRRERKERETRAREKGVLRLWV